MFQTWVKHWAHSKGGKSKTRYIYKTLNNTHLYVLKIAFKPKKKNR